MKNEVFSIKVSINSKYKDIVDFYTKGKTPHSLSKLINVLLDEVEKNKPFKFQILKKIEAFEAKTP